MKIQILWDVSKRQVVQKSTSHSADHILYPLCAKWKFTFAVTAAGSEDSPEVHGDFTKYLKYPVNKYDVSSQVNDWNCKA